MSPHIAAPDVCDGTSAVGESPHRIPGASVGQPTEPCLGANPPPDTQTPRLRDRFNSFKTYVAGERFALIITHRRCGVCRCSNFESQLGLVVSLMGDARGRFLQIVLIL
jgi:hypothetical protein